MISAPDVVCRNTLWAITSPSLTRATVRAADRMHPIEHHPTSGAYWRPPKLALDPDQAAARKGRSGCSSALRSREASVMPEAAEYSVREHLRDDRPITIRALRPDDRAGMLTAIGRTSMQSLQRRFFVPKKGFSEREMAFFLDIDFESHVAIVAEIPEDGSPVIAGGGRYIVVHPDQAEVAFVVVDAYP